MLINRRLFMRFIAFFVLILSTSQLLAAFTMQQVAQGIYVHQGVIEIPNVYNHDAIANIGFIVGDECVAVIDSGGSPAEGLKLKQAIKKITAVPICFVINTHVHPDHIFGNSAFINIPHIKFIGHRNLTRAMSDRGAFYLARSKEQMGYQLTARDIVVPTISVTNNMELDLGDRVLQITAHPTAHTDNDLSILDLQTNSIWLSDLLFIGHLPVLDGSLNGWLKEIIKLEQRQFDVVIPGHGPIERDWPESLQLEKRYLLLLQKVKVQNLEQF